MKIVIEFNPDDPAEVQKARATLDQFNAAPSPALVSEDGLDQEAVAAIDAVVRKLTSKRRSAFTEACMVEVRERGARLEPGKDLGTIRCYAPGSSTGAYAVIHSRRGVLRLPASLADDSSYAYPQENDAYGVAVKMNTPEETEEFHRLAGIAADCALGDH